MTGLKARGGFEFDLTWKNGRLTHAVVRSSKGGVCRLRSLVPLKAKGLKKARGEQKNPLFAIPTTPDPFGKDWKQAEKPKLPKTYLYDLETQPGQSYSLL